MIELSENEAEEIASAGEHAASWAGMSPGMRKIAAGALIEMVRLMQLAGWRIKRPRARRGRTN